MADRMAASLSSFIPQQYKDEREYLAFLAILDMLIRKINPQIVGTEAHKQYCKKLYGGDGAMSTAMGSPPGFGFKVFPYQDASQLCAQLLSRCSSAELSRIIADTRSEEIKSFLVARGNNVQHIVDEEKLSEILTSLASQLPRLITPMPSLMRTTATSAARSPSDEEQAASAAPAPSPSDEEQAASAAPARSPSDEEQAAAKRTPRF